MQTPPTQEGRLTKPLIFPSFLTRKRRTAVVCSSIIPVIEGDARPPTMKMWIDPHSIAWIMTFVHVTILLGAGPGQIAPAPLARRSPKPHPSPASQPIGVRVHDRAKSDNRDDA